MNRPRVQLFVGLSLDFLSEKIQPTQNFFCKIEFPLSLAFQDLIFFHKSPPTWVILLKILSVQYIAWQVLCDSFLILLWYSKDTSMVQLWYFYSMILIWYSYDTSVKLLWYFYDDSVILCWSFSDTSMKQRRYFYDTVVVLLWYFYDTTMLLLWNFYDTSMILQWYSTEMIIQG